MLTGSPCAGVLAPVWSTLPFGLAAHADVLLPFALRGQAEEWGPPLYLLPPPHTAAKARSLVV